MSMTSTTSTTFWYHQTLDGSSQKSLSGQNLVAVVLFTTRIAEDLVVNIMSFKSQEVVLVVKYKCL